MKFPCDHMQFLMLCEIIMFVACRLIAADAVVFTGASAYCWSKHYIHQLYQN